LKNLQSPPPQGNEPGIKIWLGAMLFAGLGYVLITHWPDVLKALAN
jgi:hypothetical protein